MKKNNPKQTRDIKKEMKTIQHGKEDEYWYCRYCRFSGFGESGGLAKARRHCEKTGHTVYYHTWREVTKKW